MQGDAHLAPAREHVRRAVVVPGQERPVGRRRLGELVDLLPQRGDVLAGLPQGVGQALVLRQGLLQLALGLEEPLLQGPHPLGGVGQPPAQGGHLLFESGRLVRSEPALGPQFGHLPLLGAVSSGLLVAVRPTGPPPCSACSSDFPAPPGRPVRGPSCPGLRRYCAIRACWRLAVHGQLLGTGSPGGSIDTWCRAAGTVG